MKKVLAMLMCLSFIGFISCGGGENSEVEELKQFAETMKDLPEKAEELEKRVDRSEEIIMARKERGDTLAMNYKDLQKYLPTEIPGYTAGKPGGETTNMMMFSLSEAKVQFQTADGESVMNVKVIDFNQHAAGLMAMAFWMNGYSREDDSGFERTFDTGIDDVFAFEKFNNKNGRVEVTYSVAYRFIVEVTATFQKNTDLARKVLAGMNIKELAKL